MTPQELLGKLKIDAVEETDGYGKFVFEPLPVGYGQTLGNSLRRVLLSSLEGAAVTYAKIEGVSHQFSTVPGVKEDVIDLIQNIKKIRLAIHNNQPVVLKLEVTGPGKVTASDFEVVGSGTVINGDLEIATLADKKTKLSLELTAEPGFGYVPSEEHSTAKIGVIPVDSIFTPVTHVSYKVEPTRLGQATNLDRLTIEVTTDKTVSPSNALHSAARIMVDYFKVIEVGKAPEVLDNTPKASEVKQKVSESDSAVPVEDLGLSTRTANALVKAKVKTLGELLEKKPEDFSKVRGLGDKGVTEITDLLKKYGWGE